jgi:hypothetical protein
MNASSSSLPTGWITVWIALGVVALGVFIALPLAVSQKSQKEFVRFQACATMTQRTNCEPSLAWAMNGWSLAKATSTLSIPDVVATSTTPSVTTPEFYTSSSPIEKSLISGFTINSIDVEELGARAVMQKFKAGQSLDVRVSLKTESLHTVSANIVLSEMPDDRATTNITKNLSRSKEDRSMYSAEVSIPADWVRNSDQPGALMIVTIKDAAGKTVQEERLTLGITR